MDRFRIGSRSDIDVQIIGYNLVKSFRRKLRIGNESASIRLKISFSLTRA